MHERKQAIAARLDAFGLLAYGHLDAAGILAEIETDSGMVDALEIALDALDQILAERMP